MKVCGKRSSNTAFLSQIRYSLRAIPVCFTQTRKVAEQRLCGKGLGLVIFCCLVFCDVSLIRYLLFRICVITRDFLKRVSVQGMFSRASLEIAGLLLLVLSLLELKSCGIR